MYKNFSILSIALLFVLLLTAGCHTTKVTTEVTIHPVPYNPVWELPKPNSVTVPYGDSIAPR